MEKGFYGYQVMPFGPKNTRATYQRLNSKIFKDLIGKSMEIYIDDMLVKIQMKEDYISHLTRSFQLLTNYQMKLNPSKCTFGVSSSKFVGYMVTSRGIKASLTQVKALVKILSPPTWKKVQRLTGRIIALYRFISKSSDKCKPFFKLLKENKKIRMKQRVWSSVTTTKAISYHSSINLKALAMRGVIYLLHSFSNSNQCDVNTRRWSQKAIYYVRKNLFDVETQYAQLEKAAFTLVSAS